MDKRMVKIALLQHSCGENREANLDKAEALIRRAASEGAQIICTQELFTGTYFPQTIDMEKYQWAEPLDGKTNKRLQNLSKELDIVTICSFYEHAADGIYFNTAAVYDAGGAYLGKYRKHHIPEAPRFIEKYYFTPGDDGYPVFKTKFGTIGVLICWDEWFPGPSRILALKGAELVFYPTAIGVNEDLPDFVTAKPWRKAIISNGIHNNMFVAAPNRVGREFAVDGSGSMNFYGTSFAADPWGEILAEAKSDKDEVIFAEMDLNEVKRARDILQFHRDRRPDSYGELLQITLKNNKRSYRMPAEWERHEGTWLQWPHDKTNKGECYRSKLDPIWVCMTKELHYGENVHIIVYDEAEKQHVISKLSEAKVDLDKVSFLIAETDDIWTRDDGPIFVKDENNGIRLTNWTFNGWGNRYPFEKDNRIPEEISKTTRIGRVDVPLCLEGGGIEVNGNGAFMAAKSSIINENRNPGRSEKEIEEVLSEYLGVDNFLWITGIKGEDNGNEVTDFHIDGAARFAGENTIIYEYDPYMESEPYLLDAYKKHYEELRKGRNKDGKPFQMIPMPVTRKIVKEAGSKGSYLNYYVGNDVVLVPIYGDENDALGLKIIEGQFPGRKIVGISVCELYAYGGMIHCVTQQQPT